MPRREPLASRQARSRKLQYCQHTSLQDATKTVPPETAHHEKVERHIRFDLSRNQFFFLPSKNQLKKQALTQAENVKPTLLFTALSTRPVHSPQYASSHKKGYPTNPTRRIRQRFANTPRRATSATKRMFDFAHFSQCKLRQPNNRVLKKGAGRAPSADNGLKRVVVNADSHTDTVENCTSTTLRDTKTKSTPSQLLRSTSTEKGITVICAQNNDKVSHDTSSSELLSLLKYPPNSERFSRTSSQKNVPKSRYGQHSFSPIRSASTADGAVPTPV